MYSNLNDLPDNATKDLVSLIKDEIPDLTTTLDQKETLKNIVADPNLSANEVTEVLNAAERALPNKLPLI